MGDDTSNQAEKMRYWKEQCNDDPSREEGVYIRYIVGSGDKGLPYSKLPLLKLNNQYTTMLRRGLALSVLPEAIKSDFKKCMQSNSTGRSSCPPLTWSVFSRRLILMSRHLPLFRFRSERCDRGWILRACRTRHHSNDSSRGLRLSPKRG
jgi:hypothetical protein